MQLGENGSVFQGDRAKAELFAEIRGSLDQRNSHSTHSRHLPSYLVIRNRLIEFKLIVYIFFAFKLLNCISTFDSHLLSLGKTLHI